MSRNYLRSPSLFIKGVIKNHKIHKILNEVTSAQQFILTQTSKTDTFQYFYRVLALLSVNPK